MRNAEILTQLGPRSLPFDRRIDAEDARWQDILQAMHGIDHWKISYLLFVYAGDKQSRHNFFAGLFSEIMGRPEVHAWIQQRSQQKRGYDRDIEKLCLLSIQEWGHPKPFTQPIRARLMDTSLTTWKRVYDLLYKTIMATPVAWEKEVMEIVTKRLI